MKMPSSEDELESFAARDAKRQRGNSDLPSGTSSHSLPMNPSGSALADGQYRADEASLGSLLSASFAAPGFGGVSWGRTADHDAAASRIEDMFAVSSNRNHQATGAGAQLGELQSFLQRQGTFPRPMEGPQQVDQAALLQNLLLSSAGEPMAPSYGPSADVMRELLLRENSRHIASQRGVDMPTLNFGSGAISQLLSSMPGPHLNASVFDLMAAQAYRSAPPAAPPPTMPMSQAFLPPGLLGPLGNPFAAHGSTAGAMTEPSHPLRSLDSFMSVPNVSSTTSSSATRTTESTAARPRGAVPMYCRSDDEVLSEYQCLLRKQMEYFEATPDDVACSAQGRNKPIQPRQIGIRCVHCAHLPPKCRPRGAVYYPSKLHSVYQSAQNMAVNHFQSKCPNIPDELNDALNEYKSRKCLIHGGGKQYWASTAQSAGIVEVESGLEFEG